MSDRSKRSVVVGLLCGVGVLAYFMVAQGGGLSATETVLRAVQTDTDT
ncbi:hypothetical protein [Roseobacter sp.]